MSLNSFCTYLIYQYMDMYCVALVFYLIITIGQQCMDHFLHIHQHLNLINFPSSNQQAVILPSVLGIELYFGESC